MFSITMTLMTVYALFIDDFRVIFFSKSVDDYFYGLTVLCFISFSTEIILSCLGKEKYMYSFFFWLDLMSTFSLLFDIGWVVNKFSSAVATSNAASLIKISRAGRITRVLRVIRLIRLIRIVKLYKQARIAARRKQKANVRMMEGKLTALNKEDSPFKRLTIKFGRR